MNKLKPYKIYQPVKYDYVSQLPEGWKLLPNIAIFREHHVDYICTYIKWFDKIPKHWNLMKLKHFANHVQIGSSRLKKIIVN